MINKRILLSGMAALFASIISPLKAAPRLRDLSDNNFSIKDSFIKALLSIKHADDNAIVWEGLFEFNYHAGTHKCTRAIVSDECWSALNDKKEDVKRVFVAGAAHYPRSGVINPFAKVSPYHYRYGDRNGLEKYHPELFAPTCYNCDNSGWIVQSVISSKPSDKINTWREQLGPCHVCKPEAWREWSDKVAEEWESKAA